MFFPQDQQQSSEVLEEKMVLSLWYRQQIQVISGHLNNKGAEQQLLADSCAVVKMLVISGFIIAFFSSLF